MILLIEYPYLIILLCFAVAFSMSYVSIPPIIALAKAKGLYDKPNGRSVHSYITPTLGGIAIFAGFVFSSLVFSCYESSSYISYLTAGCLLIFLVGLKDDVFVLSPFKKMLTQIIAALIVVVLADVRITSLHGLFGIHEIHYALSFLISMFVFVAITNAINLIDGINGLSALLSIMAALSFGIWFFIAGFYNYAVLCFALTGSLSGFLPFNISKSGNCKIFMGDTGSLLTGFVLAFLAIGFNEANLVADATFKISSAPAVSIGFLFIPIFDTLRVMIIRIIKKQSPFSADKRHVHHLLLKLGHSHLSASLTLSFATLIIIIFSLFLSGLDIILLLCAQFALGVLFYLIPFTIMLRRLKKKLQTYNFF